MADGIFLPVRADFRALRRDLQGQLPREVESATSATDGLGLSLKDATLAGAGFAALIAGRLSSGFSRLFNFVGRATLNLVDFTELGLLAAARGLRSLAARLKEQPGLWGAMGNAANTTAGALERVVVVLAKVGAVITGLKVAAVAGAAALAVMANRASAEFTPAWNRVLTLLDGSPESFARIRQEVSALAGELGIEGPAAAETFYQVLSAMPQLAKDPIAAMEVLRVSLEAGATGFTSAAEAAEAITAVLNAYGLGADKARAVSDALFAAQDAGVLTFGEIASAIGRVSGLAASLGVDYTELLAITASLTQNGASAAEALTAQRAILSNILKPSEQAKQAADQLGVSMDAAALRAKGLTGLLVELARAADGDTEALVALFGSIEASNAIVQLASDTAELEQIVTAVGTAAGGTAEKLELMNDSAERQREILGQRLKAELRSLGGPLERFQIRILGFLNDLFEAGDAAADAINKATGAAAAAEAGGAAAPIDRVAEAQREERRAADEALGITRRQFTTAEQFKRALGELATALGVVKEAEEEGAEASRLAAEERERAIRAILFGQLPSLEGVTGEVIGRPAAPEGVDASIEKARELEQSLQAAAAVQLFRTGDVEAYEAALRDADGAVNDLIASELKRLREGRETDPALAGVSDRDLERLALLFRRVTTASNEAARAVRERLADALFELTATAIDRAERGVNHLEAELRRLGQLDAEAQAGIARLRQRNVESRQFQDIEQRTQSLLVGVRIGLTNPEELREIGAELADFRRSLEESDPLSPLVESAARLEGELVRAAGAFVEIPEGAREAAARLTAGLRDELERRQTELRLDLAEDLIDEETFEEEGRRAAEAFNAGLLELIQRLESEGSIDEAGRRALVGLFQPEGEDPTEDRIRNLRDQARTIEENARAALQFANALGVVDSETAQTLQSMVQLGTAVARLAGGDLTAIPAALGALGGLFSGFFGGGRSEAEKQRELIQEMIELRNALRDLTDAVLSDISGQDLDRLLEGFRPVVEQLRDDLSSRIGFTFRGPEGDLELLAERLGLTVDETLDQLLRLEELSGLDVFDETKGLDVSRLIEAFELIDSLSLGLFPPTLEGQIERFRFEMQFLGEAFENDRQRVERLLELLAGVEGAEGLAAGVESVFASQKTVEAVEQFLADLALALAAGDEALFEEGAIFFGLSPEEAQAALEALRAEFDALGDAITSPADRLRERLAALSRRWELLDVPEVQRLEDLRQVLAEFTRGELGQRFATADFSEAGALDAIIRDVLGQIDAGTFDESQLAGLSTDELLDLLLQAESLEDALHGLEGSANAVNDSFGNIPRGFRLFARIFEATEDPDASGPPDEAIVEPDRDGFDIRRDPEQIAIVEPDRRQFEITRATSAAPSSGLLAQDLEDQARVAVEAMLAPLTQTATAAATVRIHEDSIRALVAALRSPTAGPVDNRTVQQRLEQHFQATINVPPGERVDGRRLVAMIEDEFRAKARRGEVLMLPRIVDL